MKEITPNKRNIDDVFRHCYNIPSYQRHYVWSEENVLEMLNDFKEYHNDYKEDEYFFGAYIIHKNKTSLDILDGQQRITTLFLLFAFMRDYEKLTDGRRRACNKRIIEEGDEIFDTEPTLRLSYNIRGAVSSFLKLCILKQGGISNNWKLIEQNASKSEYGKSVENMCNALVCIRRFFEDNQDLDVGNYLAFILQKVVMLEIKADTLDDAFRLFSVINARGQRLSNADLIKSSNIEQLRNCTEWEINQEAIAWEDMEKDLGNDIDKFLGYIRTMILKKRQRETLLIEFDKCIFKPCLIQKGKPFLEFVKTSYRNYNYLVNLDNNENRKYCALVRTLNKSLQSSDWIPIVMYYYQKFGDEKITDFLKKIACKNIADMVCGSMTSQRIDNMNCILEVIDKKSTPSEVLAENEVFSFDNDLFVAHLNSHIYGRKYALVLLMLLEYTYSDKAEWKDFGVISIEHILPQTPSQDSQWVRIFSDVQRNDFTHKLGNLCIIGRRKNTSLGNLDFHDKRDKYFNKNDVGTFAFTQRILNLYDEWNPATFEANHKRVVEDLKSFFGIKK